MRKVGSENNLGIMISLIVLCLMTFGLLGSMMDDVEETDNPMEKSDSDLQTEQERTLDNDVSYDNYVTFQPDPTPFSITQPDGTEFTARMVGERIGGHTETLDGYSIIEDESNWWTYAEKGEDGLLIPSGYKVGWVNPETIPSLIKHLSNDYPDYMINENSPFIRNRGTRAPLKNGTWKGIAIILEFPDESFDADHNQSYFENLLNGTSGNTMRTYYQEVSYGIFDIWVDVVGPYTSAKDYEWYGANSGGGRDNLNGPVFEMAREAVNLADDDVDFSKYDMDGDGVIDALFIIHAGVGEEEGGGSHGSNAVWSHKWNIGPAESVDGVDASPYSTEPESGKIGVFAHEFGHILGLPDLYDRDYSSPGIGRWGIMAGGSWGEGGTSPAHFCAWSKIELGWVEPIIVTSDVSLTQLEIPPVENHTVIYKIWAHDPSQNTDEYFLVENRQKIGFDSSLPAGGILIWHIDETVPNNDNESHYKVDLEEADGTPPSHAGDVWVDNVTGFRHNTNPNSTSYNGSDTGVWVWNISAIQGDGNMSLGFKEIYSGPTGIFISDPISNSSILNVYDFKINDTEFPDEDVGHDNEGNNGSFTLQWRHTDTSDPWENVPNQVPINWTGGEFGIINCTTLIEGFWDFRVKILDEEGHLLYTPIIINISIPTKIPPVADAGQDNLSDVNVPVYLDGSNSSDNSGYIAWFNWSFGDGSFYNGTKSKVSHIYTVPGLYVVTLNVSDSFGNWDTDTVNITVSDISPPTTTLTIGEPKHRKNFGDNYNVTESTSFILSAEDNYSGVNFTWYKIDGDYFEGLIFNLVGYPDGTHNITWGSADNANNNETGNYKIVNVDNTPPETDIYIDIPKYQLNSGDPWNVTDTTLITLIPSEEGCGVNYTWYMIESDYYEGTSFYLTGYDDGQIQIFWSTEDNLGNYQVSGITVNLDTSPPLTNLSIGSPKFWDQDPGDWYVTSSTEFSFIEIDDGEGSQVNFTWYTIDGFYYESSAPFTLTPGMHTITWGSEDNLGMNETGNAYEVFVEDTPPITIFAVGTPKYSSSPPFVNTSTEFNLTATDGVGSGVAGIWYKIDSGSWTLYNGNFTISTPGAHTIYYNSTDNLGQDESTMFYDIFMDDILPDTTLTVGDPKYGSFPTYITSSTEFNLTASDGVGSGVAGIWYKIDSDVWTLYTGNFIISTPGAHTLYYNSTDNLGQDEITKSVDIFVDDTPPDTTLTVGNPKYSSSPTYVNSSTEFNLTASDGVGSGVAGIWYKIDSDVWTLYAGNFIISTPGAHTIYYNSTDNLGGEEPTKSYEIFVDNTPPDTTLTVGNPKYSPSPTYVNSSTEFNLTATDDVGSGVASIWFKIDSDIWKRYTGNFIISTPGTHTVYYNSTDNLGQDEITKSFDIFVDNTPPDTTITVGNPKYGSSPTYVNTNTEFNLTATDGVGSGVVGIWYKIDSDAWMPYSENFLISTSGAHTIYYYSTDVLGQDEITESYDIIVDDTPPSTDINISEPKHRANDDHYWNVTVITAFILTSEDLFSGVDFTWYTINGEYFEGVSFDLSAYDEGLYIITYGSIDNLGSNETNPPIIVYLNMSAPITNLTIEEPKHRNPTTDCWNVTSLSNFLLTPLYNLTEIDFTWYTIDGQYFVGDTFTLLGFSEGLHSITWGSQDSIGYNETNNFIMILLDDSKPTTEIKVGVPRYPKNPSDNWYITKSTTILLLPEDLYSGVNFTWYIIDGEYFEGTSFSFSSYSEGLHNIKWGSVDNLGNNETGNTIIIYLDDSTPITSISVGEPKYPEYSWDVLNVTDDTLFALTSYDQYSGVNFTWYTIDGDYYYYEGSAFDMSAYEDGLHTIYWGSIDYLGWNETNPPMMVNLNRSSPSTNLSINGPFYHETSSDYRFVDTSTQFTLTVIPTPSGIDFTWFTIDDDYFEDTTFNLTSYNEGNHVITWGSQDNLGNNETGNSITLWVDYSPPKTELEIGLPRYPLVPYDGINVTSSTIFSLLPQDNPEDYSGIATTWFTIDSDYYEDTEFDLSDYSRDNFVIRWGSIDNLDHNESGNMITVWIDDSPPKTKISYTQPKYPFEDDQGYYVTSETIFSLSASDNPKHNSGLSFFWYTVDSDYYQEASFNLLGYKEKEHIITWGSVDYLGNNETGNSLTVILDNSHPYVARDIISPKYHKMDDDFWNVTEETSFHLTSSDEHSGVQFTWYIIDGEYFEGLNFRLQGYDEGLHTIIYGSIDYLGNNGTQDTIFVILDKTPPKTDISVGNPKIRNDDKDYWNITYNTNFILIPKDKYSGVDFSWYTIDGDYFNGAEFNLVGYDDGVHVITWGSVDNLDFKEIGNILSVYLDITPPEISIEIGVPKYVHDGVIYINSSTPITLISNDTGIGTGMLYYSLDGGITYHIYDSPFTVPSMTTEIIYGGEDILGNKADESTFYITVNNKDTDDDGIDDISDEDDDGDGLPDLEEDYNRNGIVDSDETDPLNPDTDEDGHIDSEDKYPLDDSRWRDPTDWEKIPIAGGMDQTTCLSLVVIGIILLVIMLWIFRRWRMYRAKVAWKKDSKDNSGNK